MDHVRTVIRAIFAGVGQIKPLRQVEIELNRAHLPLAADGILDLQVDLVGHASVHEGHEREDPRRPRHQDGQDRNPDHSGRVDQRLSPQAEPDQEENE